VARSLAKVSAEQDVSVVPYIEDVALCGLLQSYSGKVFTLFRATLVGRYLLLKWWKIVIAQNDALSGDGKRKVANRL